MNPVIRENPTRNFNPFFVWPALTALVLAACGGGEPPAEPAPAPGVQTPAVPAPAEPASPPADVALTVDQLLAAARSALDDERLVAPPGSNAVEFYLAVLEQQPTSEVAKQALVDIFPLAANTAERAIAQRDVAEAERIISLLDRASPGSFTVTSLRGKADAARQALVREQQQAEALAAQAAAARAAAAQQVEAASVPAPPEPEQARPPPPAVASAPAPATSTARPVAAAPQPASSPPQPATSPPQPAAPAARPPEPAVGPTRAARVIRQVPPQYPADAARKRQSGWVEVEFVIGADGRVRDVQVAGSSPPRVFDREAVRAIQQWSFEPALRDGQPVESRARRRIEFTL